MVNVFFVGELGAEPRKDRVSYTDMEVLKYSTVRTCLALFLSFVFIFEEKKKNIIYKTIKVRLQDYDICV